MKIIRIITVVLLAGVFTTLAIVLYQKQKQRFTFRSFELPNPTSSIFIPDLDRLLRRLNEANEFEELKGNEQLFNGFSQLFDARSTRFNEILGASCFVSFESSEFNLVFKNQSLTSDLLITMLKDVFAIDAKYEAGIIKLPNASFNYSEFGSFRLISTAKFNPNFVLLDEPKTNADFVVFHDSIHATRRIIANNQFYSVWNDTAGIVKGDPIQHNQFVDKIPFSFETVDFYGSTRFSEDKNSLLKSPSEEAYSWVKDGILIVKKGGYEILIAPQNDQRDLKLILEEQTLSSVSDTIQITTINVKNFEIMPFVSNFKWHEQIPALTQALTHYTEYENFNVLANSIDAMQWYLSEIQTGNLVFQNADFQRFYFYGAPQNAHYLHLEFNGDLLVSNSINWTAKNLRINTATSASLYGNKADTNPEGRAFEVPFEPLFILPKTQQGKRSLLIASNNKIAMLDSDGTVIWNEQLSGNLIKTPEFIDVDKDGDFEIAIFTSSEFSVYSSKGKIKFSVKPSQTLKGGMCVNYDEAYDFRFFLVFSNSVLCYDEKGQIVNGWQFSNLPVALTDAAFYTQINGVDFLTFKDVNSKVYLLNRRGENRFTNNVVSKLPNESEFVIGKNEELVHKLGYSNQYIYTRFLKDGYTDSLKLDKSVNAVRARWIYNQVPQLLIEEPSRLLLFNTIGYLEQEILKPQDAPSFIEAEFQGELRYVFFNNSNNSLYLLDKDGKILVSGQSIPSHIYGLSETHFYTFDGLKIKEQKIK